LQDCQKEYQKLYASLPDFPFSNIWNEAIRLITNIGHVDSLKTELKEDVKHVIGKKGVTFIKKILR